MPNISLTIEHPVTQAEIEVDIEFTVTAAEPDVGIMSWGIEDECIVGEHADLNARITEAGWKKIREKIHNDFDPYDPYDHDYECR